MSPSTSCSAILRAARGSEALPVPLLRRIGAESASEFFRTVVEPLSDSFDLADAEAYDRLMRAWDLERPVARLGVPVSPSAAYVLSRVTLGSDIKIVSPVLDAMKRRFPEARIVFVGGRKSAELFAEDGRVQFLEAAYPRTGSMEERIAFASELRARITEPDAMVVDPDSRLTQLGLVPLHPNHFHFPSRTAGSVGPANLSDLTSDWLFDTFGIRGAAYIAPTPVPAGDEPFAAISLGVGGNDSKCLPGNFESRLVGELGSRFPGLWIDRGAGGEEARRVTAAVEASGQAAKVRYWEGSFAAFASIISQAAFYAGYDSAGQHAAAACGIPTFSVFAGAPSERFENRWAPKGPGLVRTVSSRLQSPDDCLRALADAAAMIEI